MPHLPIELWEYIFKTPSHRFYVKDCLPPRLANKSFNNIIRNSHIRFVMKFTRQDDLEKYLTKRTEAINLRFSDIKFNLNFGFTFLEPDAPLTHLLSHLCHLKVQKQCLDHKTTNILPFLTNIETLKLDKCDIGPAEAKEIAQLSTLQKLDLCCNKVDTAFNDLTRLTHLIYLNIRRNHIKEIGYEDLMPFTSLQKLVLVCNSISEQGIQAIRQLTNLTALDVLNCNLNPQTVSQFSTLTNLKSLDFSYNQIDDKSLQYLALLSNLTALYARGCGLNDQHAEHINGLTQLTILDLSHCHVSAKGLYLLTTLTRLQTLYFETKTLEDEKTQALITLTSLTSLNLGNPIISNLAFQNLSKLSNLTRVSDKT